MERCAQRARGVGLGRCVGCGRGDLGNGAVAGRRCGLATPPHAVQKDRYVYAYVDAYVYAYVYLDV